MGKTTCFRSMTNHPLRPAIFLITAWPLSMSLVPVPSISLQESRGRFSRSGLSVSPCQFSLGSGGPKDWWTEPSSPVDLWSKQLQTMAQRYSPLCQMEPNGSRHGELFSGKWGVRAHQIIWWDRFNAIRIDVYYGFQTPWNPVFFGDNFLRFGPVDSKFLHRPFQPKCQFLSI